LTTYKFNQNGFAVVEGLLVVVVLAVIGGVGTYLWHSAKSSDKKLSTSSSSTSASPSFTQSTMSLDEWTTKYKKDYVAGLNGITFAALDVEQNINGTQKGDLLGQCKNLSSYVDKLKSIPLPPDDTLTTAVKEVISDYATAVKDCSDGVATNNSSLLQKTITDMHASTDSYTILLDFFNKQ